MAFIIIIIIKDIYIAHFCHAPNVLRTTTTITATTVATTTNITTKTTMLLQLQKQKLLLQHLIVLQLLLQ